MLIYKQHVLGIVSTVLATAVISCGMMTKLSAASLPNGTHVLSYVVVDQDIRDVLAGIGEQLGLRTKISERVHGMVHGRLPPGSAEDILNRLAALYNLDWYFSSGTLFISSKSETTLRVVELGSVMFEEFASTLEELGIADKRWPVRLSGHGLALASGPPDYLALLQTTYDAMAKRPRDGGQVRVFRGSAASVP